MNRYIITREQLRGREYYISALYDENGKMIEVLPESANGASMLGNIYVARVERVMKNLNAAFVKIGPDQNCYLSFEDVKNPVFTRRISEKKPLVAGDELLVQVSREAQKTKEPAVTTNLTLTGTYAVVSTGNRKLSVSAKLTKEQRIHYLNLLRGVDELHAEDEAALGVIVRTNAALAEDEAVCGEIALLAGRMRQLLQGASHAVCYTCLYHEPPAYLRHVYDLRQGELAEIVTDDREIFEAVCAHYGILPEQLWTAGSVSVPVECVETDSHVRIRHYTDNTVSLSALYGVKSGMEDALKERVWLKSGAYLIIQPTEALTVIDVNTGKNIAPKEMQENFLKVNKEAATEIARQLRLRNISGIVLVDFMNLASREAKEDLLSHFRTALREDPVPTQLVDITKLGLVEVTRKKVRRSLREMLAL